MSISTSKSMSGLGGGTSATPMFAAHHPSSRSSASLASMVASGSGSIESSSVCDTFPTPRKSNTQKRLPPGDARRRAPTQLPTRKAKNIQREYQLLQHQTLLLVGTASLGFILFLLFTLPLPALIGLTVLVTSLGACLLVAFSAVKTRYQLELEHPLGLVRHLPETLRAHLTEKSLHDCLSPSGSVESLASLSQHNYSSRDSLSTSGSRGSLSSMTQQQQYLNHGNNRQRHQRGVRTG